MANRNQTIFEKIRHNFPDDGKNIEALREPKTPECDQITTKTSNRLACLEALNKQKASAFVRNFDAAIAASINFWDLPPTEQDKIFNKILFEEAKRSGIDENPNNRKTTWFLFNHGYALNWNATLDGSRQFFIPIEDVQHIKVSKFHGITEILGQELAGTLKMGIVKGIPNMGLLGQFNEILINPDEIKATAIYLSKLIPKGWNETLTPKVLEWLIKENEAWHLIAKNLFAGLKKDEIVENKSIKIENYSPTVHEVDEFLSDSVGIASNYLYLLLKIYELSATLSQTEQGITVGRIFSETGHEQFAGYRYTHKFLLNQIKEILPKEMPLEEVLKDVDIDFLKEYYHPNNKKRSDEDAAKREAIVEDITRKVLTAVGKGGLVKIQGAVKTRRELCFNALLQLKNKKK